MKSLAYVPILASSLLVCSTVIAQKDSSGIFKTADDFQQKKLSYAINYKTEKHKIKDDMLFEDAEVKVVHDNQTYMMKKSETYGFRNTKGEDFRFINDKSYKILNPGEPLMLYVFDHPATYPKETGKHPAEYFFSIDAVSIPQPLTKTDLKAAFPDNHKFHDALDETFKNDEDLTMYDSFHKMYKLDHILQMSTK